MPRKPRQPSYRRHKARNCAVVTINGQNHYLGPYGSPESHAKYADLIGKWRTTQGICPPDAGPVGTASPNLTVAELVLAYWKFAKGYYVKDGQPTGQLSVIKSALRYVRSGYGSQLAKDFGPLALQALQERMIADGLSRSYINGHTRRIRLMVKWAVSKQLAPPELHIALSTVSGIKKGRTNARESSPIRPVSAEIVEATLPYLPKVVADMVRFQRLTGCRPGEVCSLRPCDVDRSSDEWVYRPAGHKTEHLDRERVILLGPRAREVLLPYLLRDAQAYCFSPAESEAGRKAEMREQRKTKVPPSQRNRRKLRPKRLPQDRYVKDSYSRAITRAADRAFGHTTGPLSFEQLRRLIEQGSLQPRDQVRHLAKSRRRDEAFHRGRWIRAGSLAELFPTDRLSKKSQQELPSDGWQYMTTAHRWSPNQLRHLVATELRKKYGIEAAQLALGHSKPNTTLIYAERDLEKMARIMAECG